MDHPTDPTIVVRQIPFPAFKEDDDSPAGSCSSLPDHEKRILGITNKAPEWLTVTLLNEDALEGPTV